jgi:hypothetical protein
MGMPVSYALMRAITMAAVMAGRNSAGRVDGLPRHREDIGHSRLTAWHLSHPAPWLKPSADGQRVEAQGQFGSQPTAHLSDGRVGLGDPSGAEQEKMLSGGD